MKFSYKWIAALFLFSIVMSLFFFKTTEENQQVLTSQELSINENSKKPFVILITSYNNILWLENNINSVLSQDYDNFRMIYIDDNSSDGTGDGVEEIVKQVQQENRVTLIRNTTRKGSLANIVHGASLCHPDEIIVSVDGDDWLKHKDVLTSLNAIYQDKNVWITYGSLECYPSNDIFSSSLTSDVIENNSYRDDEWCTTHLKTFYAGLFHKIKKEDFLVDGDFFPVVGDLAFMIPMIEMAGQHSHFVPEILYVYNGMNVLSDFRKDREINDAYEANIRNRTKYLPLDTL